MLARQRADGAAGLFTERFQDFPFVPIAPGDSANPGVLPFVPFTVTSQGGRYLRCLAIRGVTNSDSDFTGLELAALRLRLQLNGQNDFIGGNETNDASFAALFDDETAPWFWFLSPPLLRAGDQLTLTVHNTSTEATLTPEVAIRLMDDDLWQELYSRDWRAERSA
jgi:hypothetical protein